MRSAAAQDGECIIRCAFTARSCFAAKLTGPDRIGFLSSIFAKAVLVKVKGAIWRDTFRYYEPAWTGGLSTEDIAAWKRVETPEALAAVQWRAVLRTTREEARSLGDRYREMGTRISSRVRTRSSTACSPSLDSQPTQGLCLRGLAPRPGRLDIWMATTLVSNRDDRSNYRGVAERTRIRSRAKLNTQHSRARQSGRCRSGKTAPVAFSERLCAHRDSRESMVLSPPGSRPRGNRAL